MSENGSRESSMPSLLMGIFQKLGSLEAMSLANRQAMVDRTELIRREVVESIVALKQDAWSRFRWMEEQIAAKEQRLRAVELAQGLAPKPSSKLSTAIRMLLKAVPISKLVALLVVAVITTVMHAMPTEMHALVKPIVTPILDLIKTTVK